MKLTQKNIKQYLEANPLGTKVAVGSIQEMNNDDYIILNYLYERLIGSDNRGIYSTAVQFTIATKDFDNRKILVDYIKQQFNVSVDYEMSNEYQYYMATCDTTIILVKDEGDSVRVWSSHMAQDGKPGGYGLRTYRKSTIKRVLFTRITNPAAFNNAPRLKDDPWLTGLMKNSTTWEECVPRCGVK